MKIMFGTQITEEHFAHLHALKDVYKIPMHKCLENIIDDWLERHFVEDACSSDESWTVCVY